MNDFVTIKTFDSFVEANFDKQKLELNEITCYLADEYTVTVKWILCNAMGGIKLRVKGDDVEKAMEVLSEPPVQIQVDFTIEGNDLICPKCKSSNTTKEKFSRSFAGISWMILGFPIRVRPVKNCRCFYCGNKWRS